MLQIKSENSPLLQIATSLLQNLWFCYIAFRAENQVFTKLLHVATNVTLCFLLLKTIFFSRESLMRARTAHEKGGCLPTATPT